MARQRIFKVERRGEVMIVTLPGTDITFSDEEVLTEVDEILHRLREAGSQHLVVDFGCTSYFGSIVLGSILKLGTRMRDIGGRLALCNLSDSGRDMLHISKFDTLWPIYDSCDEALAAAAAPPDQSE